MPSDTFKALLLDQKNGKTELSFREFTKAELPPGDVIVSVAYSSLNYKDALAVTGKGKIIRRFPLVPGIDLAGTVEESNSSKFKAGDEVLLTGCGIGEEFWGGYTQKVRVKSESLVSLPKGLSLKQAMGIGTAGFTAMLSTMALEEHGVLPGKLEVVVTGASGGVGSIAVAILSKLGYRVVASTGRVESHEYLRSLGAKDFLDRKVLATPSDKPLGPERWAGAVDTVGGETLASLLRSTALGGCVAACGLAGGHTLNMTVYPFILRGISLVGIGSAWCPMDQRLKAWDRLPKDLSLDLLEKMIQVISLEQVPEFSEKMLKGQIRGRVIVDLQK
jgi:acrylyl-CoA reductase (NADPH)